jgi:histidinol-phosphatase (PHP family)
VLIDGHVHLQPHGEKPRVDRARIELYVEHAARNGVDAIVFTEHLFRFNEALDLLYGWWDADPNPAFAAITKAYWEDHANLSLAEYVLLIEEAKADGLPVRLGIEMDWIPGRAEDLRRLLAPYAWDCVLGSVHYLGAFGIDMSEFEGEWANRDVASVWSEYADFIEDLAASGLCDVLAHPDVVNVWGHAPPDRSGFDRRIVETARRNGLALEVNTNGLRKPVAAIYPSAEILHLAREAGVPVTLASDAHYPERIGAWFEQAIAAARAAGHESYVAFAERNPGLLRFGRSSTPA